MSSENGVPMDVPTPPPGPALDTLGGNVEVFGRVRRVKLEGFNPIPPLPKPESNSPQMMLAEKDQRIADLSTSEDRLIKAVTFCIDCCKALEFEMEPWLNGGSANLDMYDTFYRRLGTILDGFPSVLEEANKQANVVGGGMIVDREIDAKSVWVIGREHSDHPQYLNDY